MLKKKTYRAQIEFKADADETGEFEAEFATTEVIDHHKDVTRRGAFYEGQETLIEPWNHGWDLPIGKGVIREVGDKAIVVGRFFLDTQAGLDHYKVVKALGPLQEWSYTFDIEESSTGEFEGQEVRFLEKLDVWGISPVTRGAGIDTGTRFVKNQNTGEESPYDHHGSDDVEGSGPNSSDEDEAEGGADGKSSGVELIRARIDIIEIEAGLDPAEG